MKEPHPSVSGDLTDTILEHIRKSDTARIATPQVLAGYHEEFQQCLSSISENTVEVVLAQELRDWCSSQNSEGADQLRDNPALSLLWGEIPLEFGLTIFDDNEVIVIVFADCGIAGLVINETRSAVRRATATYESVKQNAVVADGSKQIS